MSRAFVKEDTDAPPPPPAERPIGSAPNRVTPRGAALIEGSVAEVERKLAAHPEPDAAALLRRDLRYWRARLASMQVVPHDPAPTEVGLGTAVTIRRAGGSRVVSIVGEDEADPAAGLIAWTAPLARALEGAAVGDSVEFAAGGGVETIAVLAVRATGPDLVG